MLDIKKLLLKILSNLKSPIIIRSTTLPSTSYAANTATWVYSKDWHPTTVNGYTPIGVLQATPNNNGGLICQATIIRESYGDRFVGFVRNITSSAITDTIAVPIIYIRNDLL